MKLLKNTYIHGLAVTLAITCTVTAEELDPPVPVGSLSVNQELVRQGAKPLLEWKIDFPADVEDVVDIEDDDDVVTKTDLRVQVSVIGVGITDQNGREYPSSTYLNFSSFGWLHLFTGAGYQVNPRVNYIDRIVPEGERIRFSSRVQLRGYSYFSNESNNVVVLKNGDLPPGNAAGFADHQTSVADYLGPYIKNGRLALGPLDIIYAAELTHTDPSNRGFDIQDTIVLVRFTPVK